MNQRIRICHLFDGTRPRFYIVGTKTHGEDLSIWLTYCTSAGACQCSVVQLIGILTCLNHWVLGSTVFFYLLFWVWPPHIMATPPLLCKDMPCKLMTSMSWWIFICLLMEMYNTLFLQPTLSLSWFIEVVECVPTILDVEVFFSSRIC